MTTAQKLFFPLALLLVFTLAFSSLVSSVSANHPVEATTLVDTEDDEEESHDDDHGLQTAVAATDVAQLKAYIALLTQLIELLNKQIALKGGASAEHTDDHDDDHDDDADDHDDDDSVDDSDDDHDDDSEDGHDED